MEAEEEKLMEHAKNAVFALTNKKKKWSQKIGGFLLDIFVIIIAVNITIWFHNWNDKKHDRQLEKEFLIGVRENLVQDTTIIKWHIQFYENQVLPYYDSILSQMNSNKMNVQYIDSISLLLISNNLLSFDNSIFQSFSSAGNLRVMENRQLLNDIMSMYSTKLPFSESNAKLITDTRLNGFNEYIGNKIGLDIGPNGVTCKLSTIIHQPEVKYQIQIGSLSLMTMNQQNEVLAGQIVAVINEIDKELKDRFKYINSEK